MTTIETDRLILRPFLSGDVDAYYAYMSDPDTLWCTAALPFSWNEAQETVEHLASVQAKAPPNKPPSAFVITLKESGTLIGDCHLTRLDEDPTQSNIAYFLNRAYWNRGYATEAVRALLDYGFKTFDMKSIIAICVPENTASHRVMLKAGMVETNPLTFYAADGNFYRGEFRDVTYLCCCMERGADGPPAPQ